MRLIEGVAALRRVAGFLANPTRLLDDLHGHGGGNVALRLPSLRGRPARTIVSVGDVATARAVMHQPRLFNNAGPYPVRGPPGSAQRRLRDGMEHMNGDELALRRRLVAPVLSREHVEALAPRLHEIVREEVAGWPFGEPFDLAPRAKHLTRRLSLELLFGETNLAAGLPIAAALERHLSMSWAPGAIVLPWDAPFTPYGRVLRQARLTERGLRDWMDRRQASTSGLDLMSVMLRYRNADGAAFDANDLCGQLYFLYGASFETCAATLVWMLVMLAQHPDEAEQVLRRLQEPDPYTDLEPTAKEALRIVTPVPVVIRRVTGDCVLPGTDVPMRAGDQVLISSFAINRDEAFFPQPASFRPGRWRVADPPDAAFLSFGSGPHGCLGSWFAMASLTASVAAVWSRGRLSVVDGTRIDAMTRTTTMARMAMMRFDPPTARPAVARVSGDASRLLPIGGHVG